MVNTSTESQAKKAGLSHSEFVLPMRAYHEDMDDVGVVYYTNYLKFMSRARSEWLRHMEFDQATSIREKRLTFAVRKVIIDFLRPAYLEDMLMVGATPQRVGPVSLDFEQKVSLASGELLCQGYVKLAFIHIDTFQLRKIPRDFIARLT